MSRAISPRVRNVLCVFPHYTPSFGTFENAYPFVGVKAFMPPQGILVIANYLPANWNVRFIDENVRRADAADFLWADVVFVSGMHIQRPQIGDINRRAHSYGKVTALGGPSVSGCPEYYPEFDYLHVGELGDATDALVARLTESVARPPEQVRFETKERLPLAEFPVPAYEKLDVSNYFLGSVQFSSGCPYRCEFCDIPELYGNNPRLKTPEQIVAELDAILANGGQRAIYFVDDNFVGNRKAAKELLPHLIAWQKKNGYAVQLACEATLNIAKSPDLLEMMREAYFCTIFCGIETPDPVALKAMHKDQNNSMPVLEAIGIIHSFGMEVVSGIIMGLDTDTPDTAEKILEFVEVSHIPLLTINLLQALPRTPLWRRLEAEGRLVIDVPSSRTIRWSTCGAVRSRPPTVPKRSTAASNITSTTCSRIASRRRIASSASTRRTFGWHCASWAICSSVSDCSATIAAYFGKWRKRRSRKATSKRSFISEW